MSRAVTRGPAPPEPAVNPAPPPPLSPGTRPAPGYEILAHLARTGWLDVYDAWSRDRDCRCVVKVLRPDRRKEHRLRERLLREGRWLQDFTHPHLVRGYETLDAADPLVVLETLTGETLSHLIHRLGHRTAAADLALLGTHLCSAVHYLHGRGLLHLDIKPSNVAIDCGHAKLLDLSVARPPGTAPKGLGTFCYLAPEQATGEPLGPAADVWGIGVTLFEAATGDVPFDPDDTDDTGEGGTADAPYTGSPWSDGSSTATGSYAQLEVRAPGVRSRRRLPHALSAAIDGCLEPDPAARPTVRDLAAAFDEVLPQPRRHVPPA